MIDGLKISTKQWIQLGFVVILLGILGLSRQLLLININHQLSFLHYNMKVSYVAESMSFLKEYSHPTLMWSKWFLTVAYTLLYLGCTLLAMRILSFQKEYLKITVVLFAAVVVLSALLYGVLSLFGESYLGYRLARFCMGLVQSPIPLMILIPAFMLANQK